MDAKPRSLAVGALSHGEHSSFSFASRSEQMDTLGPFVHDGLARNERVLYVGDAASGESLVTAFGSVAARALAASQFIIEDPGDTYMSGGHFDAERMLRHYSAVVRQALADGYAGVRIAADMRWAAEALDDINDLIAYEGTVDGVLGVEPAVVLCQYDRRVFDEVTLSAIEAAHQSRAHANPIHESTHLRIERSYDPHGLTVFGDIDIANRLPFRDALVDLCRSPETSKIIDLTQVGYMDAASIAAIAVAALQSSASGGIHARVSKQLNRIFQLVCPTLPNVMAVEEVE